MGVTNVVKEDLVRLVKYCILDKAIITGIPIEDCIGAVTKNVNYNGVLTIVKTTIDETDIDRYLQEKSDNRYAFTIV